MSAGAITSANTTVVLSDLTKLSPMIWMQGAQVAIQQELQPVLDIYGSDTLDQFNRDYSYFAKSGFGSKVDEGADYPSFTNNQGDSLSLTVVKRGAAFTITEDLIDGNKYREIRLGMNDLGERLFRTMARDATHGAFTFGFSSSYTDADGKTVTNAVAKGSEAVFADTHTMADGSTFDNNLADVAIGEANLRSLQDLTTGFIDENGQKVVWGHGQKILVTSDDAGMQHAATRLTMQDWNFSSTNRDMNVFKGVFRHVTLHYVNTLASGAIDTTKDKYYYILDQALCNDSMVFGIHTRPVPAGPFEDMFNGGMMWRSKTRYDLGTIYAHLGSACPATS